MALPSTEHDGQRRLADAVIPGVIFGIVVLCIAFAGYQMALPSQAKTDSKMSYNYTCSTAKSESVDFALEGSTDNSMILFDSSQLLTTAATIPQVPLGVLGTYDYGVDVNYVGEAFDQSLWHAIAAAAYAPKVQNKKCAIIVAPTLFEDGGMDNETFGMRFSYGLYRAFCDNPNVSDASKGYAARRLRAQGISDATVDAGLRNAPQDYLNDAAFAVMDDVKLRQDLKETRTKGTDLSRRSADAPSFEWLRAAAEIDAQAASTNNDWGMQDAFYADNIDGRLDLLKDSSAKQTYKDTPEWDDFTFFLKVCRETGLEPLVIISPVHGEFFDHIGIEQKTRDYCYDRIRTICEQQGAAVADFSDREYEKYFLYDIVHFGWTGWIDVEEALVDYAYSE